MKIQRPVQAGVQALTSPSVNNEVAKGQAVIGAIGAVATLGKKLSDSQKKVDNTLSDNQAELDASDWAAQEAELVAKLQTSSSLSIDDPLVEGEIADKWLEKNNFQYPLAPSIQIPMEEVAAEVYDMHTKEYMKQYGKSSSNPAFVKKVSRIRTSSVPQVFLHVAQLRNKRVVAQNNALIKSAVEAGDEESALGYLSKMYKQGAIDPEQAQAKYTEITSEIDTVFVTQMINNINDLEGLSVVQDSLDTGERAVLGEDGEVVYQDLRLNQGQRNALEKDLEARRNQIEAEYKTTQSNTYDLGVEMYIRGELTGQWVADKLKSDKITGEKGSALVAMLEKGQRSPVTSNKTALSRFKGQIAALRYVQGDDVTVMGKSEALKQLVLEAATGRDRNGNITGNEPFITGQDHLELINAINEQSNSILRSPEYKDAMGEVKSYTGVKDMLSSLYGTAPQRTAYSDFKRDLDAYMDQEGADAKPVTWVKQNKAAYNPDVYKGKAQKRLMTAYPEYASMTKKVTKEDTNGNEKVVDELDDNQVKRSIFKALKSRSMSEISAERRLSILTGDDVDIDMETIKSLEDPSDFYEVLYSDKL